MLDQSEFEHWCHSLKLSDAARTVIEQVRHAPPSRSVQAGRQNVCGSYPSRKMGVTIQFESHRTELARIYELEHDPAVLEYYDQPPAIELVYASKSGRRLRHQHTPDFFILCNDGASWEECKPESELEQLTQRSPNRYQKSSDTRWQCPPGKAYAEQFGLSYVVWSDAAVNWTLQQNLIWLEDYFAQENVVDPQVKLAILTWVKALPGMRLATLLEQVEVASADDFYSLIASEELYVDLAADKLCDTTKACVFLNAQVAALYHQQSCSVDAIDATYNHLSVDASVGEAILWDQEQWKIMNAGATSIAIMQSSGKLVELPRDQFLNLMNQRRILLLSSNHSFVPSQVAQQLQKARPKDIQIANQRYEQLLPYLEARASKQPSSTLRRWCSVLNVNYIGILI